MTHICVSKLIIIGSDNDLLPGRRWAIIWAKTGILLTGPLGTNFSEISIEIHSYKKTYLKVSSLKCIWKHVKCRPFCPWGVNSSPPSAAYMRQWTGSELFQVMACRLFGANPLPEPMLVYCQLDSWEQISVKFESEFYHFHSGKCIRNGCLPRCRPFCPWGDELMMR